MRFFCTCFALFLPGLVPAAEVNAPLDVAAVEVFPRGASITLSATAAPGRGLHDIMMRVPRDVVATDILDWEIAGGVLLSMSVFEGDFSDPMLFETAPQAEARARVEEAEEALERHQDTLRGIEDQVEALEAQRSLLVSLAGGETLPSAEDLVDLTATLGAELAALSERSRAPLAALREAHETEDVLEATLARAELAYEALSPPDEGWLTLHAEVQVLADGLVSLSTEVFEATSSWRMTYDVDLDQDASSVVMARQAQVRNGSPLAWVDTNIVLSTARPEGQNAVRDVPRSIAQIGPTRPAPVARVTSEAAMEAPMMEAEVVVQEDVALLGRGLFAANTDGPVVSYMLDRPLTVLPAATIEVALAATELSADIYLAAAPRFDDTAFVMADIINTTPEPFLPGDALFRRDGVLVARGALPEVSAGAEVTLGFGPEPDIALSFENLDVQSGDRGFIRSSNTRVDALRVTVANLGQEPREVRLRYAVPTSQQEDLEIDIRLSPEPTTRDVDDRVGVHEWLVALAAGEEQDIDLNFSFSWPEGQRLNWRP